MKSEQIALSVTQEKDSNSISGLFGLSGTCREANDYAKTETGLKASASIWPDLVSLAQMPDVMKFPIEVFPPVMSDYLNEVAESLGTPVDFPALSAMTVAASEIGNSRSLYIKDGYYESCRMYSLLVGDVGSSKSQALSIPAKPLRDRHHQWVHDYREQLEDYRIQLEEWELAKKKAIKKGNVYSIKPPDKPTLRQNHVDNYTIESLGSSMNENPRGMIVIKDEATGWLAQMNAYRGGRGDDRQFYLSCFTGQHTKVSRKNAPDGLPIVLENPFLNILCTVQPALLYTFCDQGASFDGLIERFLFAYPDETLMPFFSEAGISNSVHQRWTSLCDKLTLLEGTKENSGSVPVICQFTPNGKACWFDSINNKLIKETHDFDFPNGLKPYWAKLRMYYARFALLLTLIHNAAKDSPEYQPYVNEKITDHAWLLIRYFQSTYRRVYRQLSLDRVGQQAKHISKWLDAKRPQSFKRHELYQNVKHNNLFPKIQSLDDPLQLLCDHFYLRRHFPIQSNVGRPPGADYEVHPSILIHGCPEKPKYPEKS